MNSGIYYQSANAQALPERMYPINQAGLLEVFYCSSDFTYQRYTPYNTDVMYKRSYYSGYVKKWGDWCKIDGIRIDYPQST